MKQITIYNNFLDEVLFEECLQFSNEIVNFKNDTLNIHNKCRFNYAYWPSNIVLDSNPIYIYDLEDGVFYNKILNAIIKKTPQKIKCIMFYFYHPESHIPWHNDGNYNGGITIYLNDMWDKNNGGYFLFEQENKIQAIVPKRNMAVEQFGGVEHSVSPTTRLSDIRRTIQIFL